MSAPAVLMAGIDDAAARAIAASFEEEGVPLRAIEARSARDAAVRSPLGIGIARRGAAIEIALATGPDEPYVIGDDARAMGRIAARLAARRPLPRGAR